MKVQFGIHLVMLGCMLMIALPLFSQTVAAKPHVLLKTSMGDIELELYPDKAPVSVENFLYYVNKGFYNNTIFHRIIRNFMIQGGGFDSSLNEKSDKKAPIVNEATNGLKNKRGTIAYARTNVVNSATSQFFINHVDNSNLDHKNTSAEGFGYAVFGKVVQGMNVVDKIAAVRTDSRKRQVLYQGRVRESMMDDVPVKDVVLISAEVIPSEK